MKYEIKFYKTENGKIPFSDWLLALRDGMTRSIILARLERIKVGNMGITKSVGDGLHEIKIDVGPGYRIYISYVGRVIILLLCAGSKRTQTKDIEKAKSYLQEYKMRGVSHETHC